MLFYRNPLVKLSYKLSRLAVRELPDALRALLYHNMLVSCLHMLPWDALTSTREFDWTCASECSGLLRHITRSRAGEIFWSNQSGRWMGRAWWETASIWAFTQRNSSICFLQAGTSFSQAWIGSGWQLQYAYMLYMIFNHHIIMNI